ncbi:Hypothetical protein NCDO2118_0324 [Lactococcus lactis subsp. lactis NCDO 2118]|uniref:Bacteriocin immunity protein n=1 Tax=Lactococcus lactis subsp. lactis NCDO 2118 TaxID=1117941 RepID=A0ABC8A396_LACLL|nr:hypothetical protein [Lactococcus lactis]ADA64090.1 Hypothetical protein LLKF_0320 [Lactococcus lactis subsp. lactis KF147]AII11823.1 Hypothetical protein NCDO2118_0324 [Lactococcus lactis subsp. lactis NCDO 2118]
MSDTVITMENVLKVEKFIQKINELLQQKKHEEIGALSNEVIGYLEYADNDLTFYLQPLKQYMTSYAYIDEDDRKYLLQTMELIQNWCNNQKIKLD